MASSCGRFQRFASVGRVAAVILAANAIWLYGGEAPPNPEPIELQVIDRELVNLAAMADALTAEAERVAPQRPPRLSVLVHFEPVSARVSQSTAATRRQNVRTWAAGVGGFVKYEYDVVLPNVINLRGIPSGQRAALEAMPGVVKVEDDRIMQAHLTVSTPLIRALQSQIVGAGHSADGSGVRVCILDTGIDSDHIMYSTRIDTAAGRDFANNDNNPEDDNGHGSNVSGIAVGGTGLSLTRCAVSTALQGVAPEATLIGIKVLDLNGSGSFADVIAGINYGADQTASGGRCDVMNLSLGGGAFSGNCDGDSAAAAANNAVDAGVVVVSSSGNECNGNAMGTPACGSKVIAVGAVYDDAFPNCEWSQTGFTWCCDSFCISTCTDNNISQDDLICFSNNSTTIDVSAPGCIATSADNAPGGTTVSGQCGTSQASPHVAGLAALILSADPGLAPADVRQIIRDGAIDLGPAGFDTGYGWGRIDAINSLDLVGPGCTGDPDCDDGLFCNGAETCVAGSCQAGTPPNCNDGVACTDDSCNEGTDSCDNTGNNGNCDDGVFCNGAETCDPVLDCQAGSAINCDDGVGCTVDSCNEGTDSCDNIVNNASCDDGLFCNGSETCDAVLDCQGGTAVNCDDGVGCTDDSCNEGMDSCDNVANNGNCDNGLFCDGAETCDPVLDCQAGTSVNCDDGVGCTDDSCNEGTDSCDNVANNGNCDNGLFCDGSETCDPVLDCQSGTVVNCDDGVGCTDDSCNEGTDSCDNVANNANCDDGLFCNGAETCDALLDCQAGSDPCLPSEICNEGADTCDPSGCNNDGTCDSGEDCNTCSNDCISGSGGFCGDGICAGSANGEDCFTCSADCRCAGPGCNACCGDGFCGNNGEKASNCPVDCDPGFVPPSGSFCCGDGTCEGGEDSINCEVDCGAPPVCGDAACDAGEDQCSCPSDCCAGAPATETGLCSDGCDNDCDGLTDSADSDCACGGPGASCSSNGDCCSNKCKGNGTCK